MESGMTGSSGVRGFRDGEKKGGPDSPHLPLR